MVRKEAGPESASLEDIKDRIFYQHSEYLKREKKNCLTREWRKYGNRHMEEIDKLRTRLDREGKI